MKNRGRNATAERPPDEGPPGCRRLALLAVLALAVPLTAAAAEPPPLPPAARSRTRDLELTVHARRALRADASLGPLNLGVRVHDGVATLWGPVPTVEDVRRAVQVLEAVSGLAAVRSELRLEKGQPNDLLALPVPEDPPTRTDAASPDPLSGSLGTLTRRNPANFPPSAGPPPVAALLPPVTAAPAAPPRAAPAPLAPAEVVEALRLSERRFRRIRAEVRGGTVFLHPADTPREDVMAFYQVLAHVPGVERVVVKNDGP
jgi:BON domain